MVTGLIVLPPPRQRELKLLPYLIGGYSEQGSNRQRVYCPAQGQTFAMKLHRSYASSGLPITDFENIEQAVEGIDFSYGERYVPDRRPFFSEGGNVYKVGQLFHSRRIEDMDGGLKLFGKVGRNTSVGTLGTYHRNNQNFIMSASQSLTATSQVSAAFLSHNKQGNPSNSVGSVSGSARRGRFSVFGDLTQSWMDESDGRTGTFGLSYKGHLIESVSRVFFTDPDFVNNLGYHPFKGFRGINLTTMFKNEWREGIVRRLTLFAHTDASNTYEGEVFSRDIRLATQLLTHSDYSLTTFWHGGRFKEFSDSVFSISLGARATDRFNNFSVDYAWGEQAGEPIYRISGNLNLRAYGFTAGLTSQVQWHFKRRYQQILTLTYDFSPALSLGSRLIWQAEGINTYFALRRSGYAGTDFFIILGDPNALEFKQRFVTKVIRAF